VKIALEPVFEADFLPCSFGFRPRRSAHDALQVLIDESWQGRRWVVETDIASCFESIPHYELIQAIEERVCDQAILSLVRMLLRAGVMEGGSLRRSKSGTPQGGLCSAEHKEPYAQCWVMRSADLGGLVGAGSAGERCA
jgi:retron-type reverse transcriptase